MAKKVYRNIGSVVKGRQETNKEGQLLFRDGDGKVTTTKTNNPIMKPDYVKMSQDVTLRQGQILNLESPAAKKASIEKAVAEGKMSEESAKKAFAVVEKIPEFVRFNVVLVTDAQE